VFFRFLRMELLKAAALLIIAIAVVTHSFGRDEMEPRQSSTVPFFYSLEWIQ